MCEFDTPSSPTFTMTGPIHTYGATCLLSDDDPDLSTWYSSPTPPRVRPQFFYTSSLPIDDPLTSLPPPSGGQGSGNERAPPQPFSAKDHIALEESWKTLRETAQRKVAEKAGGASREGTSTRNSVISVPGHEQGGKRQTGTRDDGSLFGSQQNSPSASAALTWENRSLHNPRVRPSHRASDADLRPRGSWDKRLRSTPDDEGGFHGMRRRDRSSFSYNPKTIRRKTTSLPGEEDGALGEDYGSRSATPFRDVSISGSPFIRAPLPQPQSPFGRSLESGSWKDGDQEVQGDPSTAPRSSGLRTSIHRDHSPDDSQTEAEENSEDQNIQEKIPVGVSRLHLVELPALEVLLILNPCRME